MKTRSISVLLLCALALSLGGYRKRLAYSHEGGISRDVLTPAHTASLLSRALHPSYPYSVIPGGVYSPAELRFAVGSERVVREHYAGFNLSAVRLVTLNQDRLQFVSYRRGDHVFWTSKKLWIRKGEVLLTDGTNYARTRCGNRLCVNLQGHVDPHEPSAALLSLPEPKPETLSIGPLKFTPGPSLGELAQEADTLPLVPSRLKPVTSGTNSDWALNGVGPAAYNPPIGFFPGVSRISGGSNGSSSSQSSGPSGGAPGGASLPPPIVPIPPALSGVPEPKGLPVIVGIFSVSLIGLARVLRRRNPY